jgi:hypothetical protein
MSHLNSKGSPLSSGAPGRNTAEPGEAEVRVPLSNPEVLGKPIHPYLKLLGAIEATRRLARELRRFFPVVGLPWEFAESSRISLISGVGDCLYMLEDWLNPDHHPFADHRRGDPDRMVGMRGIGLGVQPTLREAVANLVRRYDAVLDHYEVEEEISTQEDQTLFWWDWDIVAIEPKLLESLERAADCLESLLAEAGIQWTLDQFRPQGVPSLWGDEDESCRDEEKAAGGDSETRGDERKEQPRPGFLGIILDEGRYEVRRKGYPPVSFGGDTILWRLLKALVRGGDAWYCNTDLARDVWYDDPAYAPDDNAIQAQITKLRKKLQPLDIGIDNSRKAGYKLIHKPQQ